jgi:proton-dependent oligopeptide transporter, POT family
MPLGGAYIADSYLGRYKTIQYALGLDILGHIILIMSAIPPVIPNKGGSIACLILGVSVFSLPLSFTAYSDSKSAL